MKRILMAAVMVISAGAAYAGSVAEELGLGKVEVNQVAVPKPTKVVDAGSEAVVNQEAYTKMERLFSNGNVI